MRLEKQEEGGAGGTAAHGVTAAPPRAPERGTEPNGASVAACDPPWALLSRIS